jgi:pilus assembly protein Flp/PilA
MRNTLTKLIKDESGATAIEYGLIAAFIGVVLVVSLKALGTALTAIFNNVATTLNNAIAG